LKSPQEGAPQREWEPHIRAYEGTANRQESREWDKARNRHGIKKNTGAHKERVYTDGASQTKKSSTQHRARW